MDLNATNDILNLINISENLPLVVGFSSILVSGIGYKIYSIKKKKNLIQALTNNSDLLNSITMIIKDNSDLNISTSTESTVYADNLEYVSEEQLIEEAIIFDGVGRQTECILALEKITLKNNNPILDKIIKHIIDNYNKTNNKIKDIVIEFKLQEMINKSYTSKLTEEDYKTITTKQNSIHDIINNTDYINNITDNMNDALSSSFLDLPTIKEENIPVLDKIYTKNIEEDNIPVLDQIYTKNIDLHITDIYKQPETTFLDTQLENKEVNLITENTEEKLTEPKFLSEEPSSEEAVNTHDSLTEKIDNDSANDFISFFAKLNQANSEEVPTEEIHEDSQNLFNNNFFENLKTISAEEDEILSTTKINEVNNEVIDEENDSKIKFMEEFGTMIENQKSKPEMLSSIAIKQKYNFFVSWIQQSNGKTTFHNSNVEIDSNNISKNSITEVSNEIKKNLDSTGNIILISITQTNNDNIPSSQRQHVFVTWVQQVNGKSSFKNAVISIKSTFGSLDGMEDIVHIISNPIEDNKSILLLSVTLLSS